MRTILVVGSLAGLLAGCSADWSATTSQGSAAVDRAGASARVESIATHRKPSSIANLPDRGGLVSYGSQPPVRKGAYTWHAIGLSEEHALRAVGEGSTMVVQAPNGEQIRLKYERHIEHPNGNWTWVGRTDGAAKGTEAILTFGEKAVFGSIPNGKQPALEVTMVAGRTWMVETDQTLLGKEANAPDAAPDYLSPVLPVDAIEKAMPRRSSAAMEKAGASKGTISAAATAANTVDLLIGYTNGFATRLGGQSQALTRLTFMVDVANEAYENSQVEGRIQLVHAMQVNYPDATSNRTALFEVSGVNCVSAPGGQLPDGVGVSCTYVGQAPALAPLAAAREVFNADLVSLVRNFNSPENQSCGISWLLGGGLTAVDFASASFGYSVVSDTSGTMFPDGGTCRQETLVHELGHNMGLQHDRETAQGGDDTNGDGNLLDREEYGRYAYSFGYRASPTAGNFVDVMAPRQTGLTTFRVFSNPRITTCGNFPCGVVDQADTARALVLTMPGVALFRTPPAVNVALRGDFNGDGRADLLWRNQLTGANIAWRSANSATSQAVTAVAGSTWKIMGAGDFNGDNVADILWRNVATGVNSIWRSGNSATAQAVTTLGVAWTVAGIGDFDADNRDDILWRNTTTGQNGIWKGGNSATPQAVTTLGTAWNVVGVGDFNADGRADILWRNFASGANGIWRSGSSASPQSVTTIANLGWRVAAVGDFDGDNRADIFWRNASSGANALWRSGNSATPQTLTGVFNPAWSVVAVGDFDGDNRDDVLWRNIVTGANGIWRSANSATPQAVTTVHLNWMTPG